MKNIVLVTGGFDPLHSGHVSYFKNAKKEGDELWVGLNSDNWLIRKKGRPFLRINERKEIIENLVMVDKVILFDDEDNSSNDAISKCLDSISVEDTLIFANGGDRNQKNIPELEAFSTNSQIKFIFEVGGGKRNSSSKILKEWVDFKKNS
tara:strand:+ start:3417 stop:3866 length:450 start_codon:yes stop_codon:yes gene_type:complete